METVVKDSFWTRFERQSLKSERRSARAFAKCFARPKDGFTMALSPNPHTAESFSQAQPQLGQFVLDPGWNDGKNRAHDKPVCFHLAKRLGQHLLAHASDQLTQASETQAPMIAKYLKSEHRPLIGHPADDFANQRVQLGVILLWQPRRRSRMRPMVARGYFGIFVDVSQGDTLLWVSMALSSAYFPMVCVHHRIEIRRRSCRLPATQF